jgi:putative DNA primase/helicase
MYDNDNSAAVEISVGQPDDLLVTASDATDARGLIVSAIKYEAPVGKRYDVKDGEVVGTQSNRSAKAVGETISFSSFEDFAAYRKSLPSECMLVSGTFEAVGKVAVVHKGEEGPGEVSASKEYLAHRAQPGVLIIDIDYKDESEVAGLYLGGEQPYKTQQESLKALKKVLPESDRCALMIGWSTSSNLFDKVGKQVKGTGGIRIYIPVTDASKIPYLLEVMHKRSWLYGEGWSFVGVGGFFHERSLVDRALERVTQPDFAAPDLHDGLTQDRGWDERDGVYLDSDTVPPLTADEEVEYRSAIKVAKDTLASAMKVERDRYLAEQAQIAVAKGLGRNSAIAAALQCLDNDILAPSVMVVFDSGEPVSVLQLLTDGGSHDGKTCKDPIEPDYNGGAYVGKFYWNNGGYSTISSFAHGKKTYRLRHDEGSLRSVIKTKNQKDIIRAFALSDVDELTWTVLVGEAATALGLGNKRKIITDAIANKRVEMSKAIGEVGISSDPIQASSVNDVVVINLKEPLSIARKFLAANYTQNGVGTLKRRSGDFYAFNGVCYRENSAAGLRAEMYKFLELCVVAGSNDKVVPVNPDMAMVSKIIDALNAVVQMDDSLPAPCWIGGTAGHPSAGELLICGNGLVHMPTRRLDPLSPAFFSLNALGYDYSADAPAPAEFTKFINSILGSDPEAEELLQEMFGYIVSGATSYQKILAIVGPKRAGKGVLGRLLTALVGKANVCNPSLGSFSNNFPLQPLIGKTLALMSDARLDAKANQKLIVEHMLRVSGEDDVNATRKNKTDWSGRLPARFMLLTNEVPRLADASGAFAGRFVTLVLTTSYYGKEDPNLTDKLLTELPGILNWALDGWDRLQKQGHFTVPASSKEVMKELEYLSSPILKFIEEECFFIPEGSVAVEDLFMAWDQWCTREGRSFPGTKATFGRDLRASHPQLKKSRRNIDRRRTYYYEGIALKYIHDPTHLSNKKTLNPLMEQWEWFDVDDPEYGPCKVRGAVRA